MVATLRFSIAAACLLAAQAAVGTGAAAPRQTPQHAVSYGRHLAAECTACHRPDAGGGPIPSLAGKPAHELIALLQDYRAGRRTNAVMVSVAQSLDDEQMAALGAYFASLPKSPSHAEQAR